MRRPSANQCLQSIIGGHKGGYVKILTEKITHNNSVRNMNQNVAHHRYKCSPIDSPQTAWPCGVHCWMSFLRLQGPHTSGLECQSKLHTYIAHMPHIFWYLDKCLVRPYSPSGVSRPSVHQLGISRTIYYTCRM
jgi:hypothetical protein